VKPLMVAAPAEATDDQLVVAAQQGSDVAFDALFRRYRERITAYVRGIVSDHARAEDIVQDVFMSALRSLRSTERQVAFKPWIYEIAKNACIDQLRRARRASEVSIDSDDFSPVDEGRLSSGVPSTDAAYSTREELAVLQMAFNDLPEAQREVLVSRELEGLSYDTISSRTGLSRSAVESMLFRARRTLRIGFDDIATGERCQRMQMAMAALNGGRVGIRTERRLIRHLSDCAACRREAVALGLDELALGASSRTRSAITRVAAFLPLPAFLRRRLFDGAGLIGSAGHGAAADGMSLAAKAGIVLAVAAIAGGGAGIAHKVGVLGGDGSSNRATPATNDPSGGAASGGGASSLAGGHSGGMSGARPGDGAASGGSDARSGSAPANGAAGGQAGPGGDHFGPLGGAGSVVDGLGGSRGSSGAGDLGPVVGGLTRGAGDAAGGTVNGVTGTVDKTAGGATGSAGNAVGGATGTVGKAVDGATGTGIGGTVDNAVKGVTAPALKTVNGATGTVTKTASGLTSPGSTQPSGGLGLQP
jgi:RNA polymerase sigma factor (sigma-70 family)